MGRLLFSCRCMKNYKLYKRLACKAGILASLMMKYRTLWNVSRVLQTICRFKLLFETTQADNSKYLHCVCH